MELQQRDVVVQRLAVVVVVDVGRGHPQGLRQSEVSIGISWTNQRPVLRSGDQSGASIYLGPRAAVLLGEVVVAHPHVDRVAGADNAAKQHQ